MDPTSVDIFYLFPSEEGFLNGKLFLDFIGSQFSLLEESFKSRIAEERYIARQTFHNTPDPLLNDESAEIIAKQRIEKAGEFENLGLASAIRFDTNLQLIIDLVNSVDKMEIVNGELFITPKSQSISAAGPTAHQPSSITTLSSTSQSSSTISTTMLPSNYLISNSLNFTVDNFCEFFFPIFQKYFTTSWFKSEYMIINLESLNSQQKIFFYHTFMSFWFSSVAEVDNFINLSDGYHNIKNLLEVIHSIPSCGIPQIVANFIHRHRGVQHFWSIFYQNITAIQAYPTSHGCKKVKYSQPISKTKLRKQRMFLKFKNDDKFRFGFYKPGFRYSIYFKKLDSFITSQTFVRFLNYYKGNLKFMVDTICNNLLHFKNNFLVTQNNLVIQGDYVFASNIRKTLIFEVLKYRKRSLNLYYDFKLSNVGKNLYSLSLYVVFKTAYSKSIYDKSEYYHNSLYVEDIIKNPCFYLN